VRSRPAGMDPGAPRSRWAAGRAAGTEVPRLDARPRTAGGASGRSARTGSTLPGLTIPGAVSIEETAPAAGGGAAAVIFAVPSHALRGVAGEAVPAVPPYALVVNVAKGLEEGTLLRMSEILAELFEGAGREVEARRVVSLLGPSARRGSEPGSPHRAGGGFAGRRCRPAGRRTSSTARCCASTPSPTWPGWSWPPGSRTSSPSPPGSASGSVMATTRSGRWWRAGWPRSPASAWPWGGGGKRSRGLSGLGDLVTTCVSRHSRNPVRRRGDRQGAPPRGGAGRDEHGRGKGSVPRGPPATSPAGRGGASPSPTRSTKFSSPERTRASAIRDLMLRDPKAELS